MSPNSLEGVRKKEGKNRERKKVAEKREKSGKEPPRFTQARDEIDR
jgi:hypothetical protein